jgi:hypothetical protein
MVQQLDSLNLSSLPVWAVGFLQYIYTYNTKNVQYNLAVFQKGKVSIY